MLGDYALMNYFAHQLKELLLPTVYAMDDNGKFVEVKGEARPTQPL